MASLQVSNDRAELARQLSQQQAAMEEEQHSRKKMRKKLGKRLEESERQIVHLQQCLEEKCAPLGLPHPILPFCFLNALPKA